jgi:hypothetical protein
MLIEYDDLVEQLKQFRLDVINMLSEIDIETDALQKAVVAKKPITTEDVKRLRLASRRSLSKFQEYNSQRLALLHERREGH